MVAIHNAADWEVDLAPGLLLQVVDLTPYVNTSALKVRAAGLAQAASYVHNRNSSDQLFQDKASASGFHA
jgi:hypothetical protein